MKKILLSLVLAFFLVATSIAQENVKDTSKLQISGSADLYYKYDLAQSTANPTPNADYPNNSFGTKLNSLSLGMLDLKLKKKYKRTSFFSDLSFGSRTDYKSNNPQNSFRIQNLYITFQLTKALSASAGAMYIFQSYEKITPVDNFNYSMSKAYSQTFANAFQRAGGIRVSYKFCDFASLNVGMYNTVDAASAVDNIAGLGGYWVSEFSSQLFLNPIKNLNVSIAYWREGQTVNGTHTNIQARYLVNPSIKIGFDGTDFNAKDSLLGTSGKSFKSAVFYAQKSFGKVFTIGGRYEYQERVEKTFTPNYTTGYYNIYTITGSEKLGPINLKEEYIIENTNSKNSNSLYLDKSGNQSHSAHQFVLAAIYAF